MWSGQSVRHIAVLLLGGGGTSKEKNPGHSLNFRLPKPQGASVQIRFGR